jgi:GTPase SAR1 family protein
MTAVKNSDEESSTKRIAWADKTMEDGKSSPRHVTFAPPPTPAEAVVQQRCPRGVLRRDEEGTMARMLRNRIVTGYLFGKDPPPEPTEAPPAVTTTVTLRLMGPSKSGKTALCTSWVHRLAPGDNNETTNVDATQLLQLSELGECYQKDVAYSADKAVRVQLWDNNDSIQPQALSSNDDSVAEDYPLKVVVDRTLLCIPMPTDDNDVDLLEQTVRHWRALLDASTNDNDSTTATTADKVVLLLTQADRATSSSSRLSKELALVFDRLCRELNIASWYTVTSCYDVPDESVLLSSTTTAIDGVFQSIVENVVAEKEQAKQCRRCRRRRRGKFDKDVVETIVDATTTTTVDVKHPSSLLSVDSPSSIRRSSRKRSMCEETTIRNGIIVYATAAKKTKMVPTVTPNDRRTLQTS